MKRLLIIKLGALGDVILAMPAVRKLCEHFGQGRVTVLTTPSSESVFKDMLGGDAAVLTVHRKRNLGLLRMGWRIRGERFDCVLDLQGNRIARWLTRISRSPLRIGLWPDPSYHQSPTTHRREAAHPSRLLGEVLSLMGIEDPYRNLQALEWPEGEDIGSLRREHVLEVGRYVLLHPGSSTRWVTKRWPEDHFRRLAERLGQQGLQVLWIGGSEDAAICARLAASHGIDASGMLSIPGLIALGRNMALAVVNDSAPMHALALSGRPVFALFGPTDPRRSHPLLNESRILRLEVGCAPCFRPVCPLKENRHHCLVSLTPDHIMERIAPELENR